MFYISTKNTFVNRLQVFCKEKNQENESFLLCFDSILMFKT